MYILHIHHRSFYKHFLPFSLFLSINLNAFSQQNPNLSEATYYQIDNYRIYPQEKVITEGRMFGNAVRNSFDCFPREHIDFDNTALVFINHEMHFKENINKATLQKIINAIPRDKLDTKTIAIGTKKFK